MQRLKRFAPALVVGLLVCLATPWLIGPPCPKRLVIATASKQGAYYQFAQRYREILARDGIELQVRCTAGSIENAHLLTRDDEAADEEGRVSLAIIQGGAAAADESGEMESLASLYLEPVWVFYRGAPGLDLLTDLRGGRIAVGGPGSGTRSLAMMLLEDSEMAMGTGSADDGTRLIELGGERAARALLAGRIDAAFFVISPQSPIVHELLEADGVELLSFRRAAAYRHKHAFLSSVTLAEGILDLNRNVPSRDIVLVAPAANLVARHGLHEALVPLLLDAAVQVHERGGLTGEQGVFPNLKFVEHPVHEGARRYFKSGPPLFYRMLPFRVAMRIDRLKLLALPLFTLLLPLLKVAPPIYRWRIRSKIYRWYRVLRAIDQRLKQADAETDFASDVARLRELDEELSDVSVPLSYMEEAYNLRLHVAYLLDRVMAKQKESRPASPPTLRLRRAA